MVIGKFLGKERGVSKAKIIKEKHEAKMEFPQRQGEGLKPKTNPYGWVWIISGTTHFEFWSWCHATHHTTT